MAAPTAEVGAPLRRVISDPDEMMMDVVSPATSSTENSPLAPLRKTSHSIFSSSLSSSSPMRAALHNSNENVDVVMMMMDDNGVFLPEEEDNDDSAQCQSSEQQQQQQPTGLIPKLMEGPLHLSSHIGGFNAMDAVNALFPPTRILATTPHDQRRHAEEHHHQNDENGILLHEDDTVSITSVHSCHSNFNNNNNNPLVTNFPASSQRSFHSQRSALSARSQSSRSTGTWGQLTEIDLPPKVNGELISCKKKGIHSLATLAHN